MSKYFLKPYERFDGDVGVELDLSNYTIKADLKGTAGVDTSNLAAKSDLARLKAKVDKKVLFHATKTCYYLENVFNS